jgi:hypothetical protein
MLEPASPKKICPHCKSAKMEHCGSSLGFQFYYKCLDCHRFTEFSLSSKKNFGDSIVVLLCMCFSLVVSILLIDTHHPRLAIFAFFGSLAVYLIIAKKFRLFFYNLNAIENLPTDHWIIPPPGRKNRVILIVVVCTVVFTYAGIVVYNLLRQ